MQILLLLWGKFDRNLKQSAPIRRKLKGNLRAKAKSCSGRHTLGKINTQRCQNSQSVCCRKLPKTLL